MIPLLVQTDSPNNAFRHNVRVSVGGRSSVLQVATSLLCYAPGDTDGGAPVGHAGGEVVDGGGLMMTCEATFVVLALVWIIGADVGHVTRREPVDGLLDLNDTIVLSHRFSGEVGVHASAIPVPRDGLGVEGDYDVEVFSHAVQQVPSHP